MTAQSEHLMELAEEILRLRRENDSLKRQLDQSVPVDVVRGLKNDLYTALAKNDEKQLKIDRLIKQNERLLNVNEDLALYLLSPAQEILSE